MECLLETTETTTKKLKMLTINSVLCICEFLVLQNIYLEVGRTVSIGQLTEMRKGIQVRWVSL
jgi:hypothetical protein